MSKAALEDIQAANITSIALTRVSDIPKLVKTFCEVWHLAK